MVDASKLRAWYAHRQGLEDFFFERTMQSPTMRITGSKVRCIHHYASLPALFGCRRTVRQSAALAFHAIEDRLNRDAPGSPQTQPIISIAPTGGTPTEAQAEAC